MTSHPDAGQAHDVPARAFSTRQTCRVCGEARLQRFLSLGPTPLANSFLQSPGDFAREPYFPLDVYFCETCSLVQLLDVVDPEVLFRDYIYVTGTSDTIAVHNARYARTVVNRLSLGKGDLVIEIASNDGSLLKCFQPYGVNTLGVEPAKNIAEIANAKGVKTVSEFFNGALGARLRQVYGPARAVVGNNVLAHVDDVVDFLTGFRNLTGEDGLIVIEVPYLGDLIDRLEYDTIYHEHLSYFSVSALLKLCDRVELSIHALDHLPIHGGSLRMYAGRPDTYGPHAGEVLDWAKRERTAGLTRLEKYADFASQVENNRTALRSLLEGLAAEGRSLAAYGAPAKGNTLLNYCRIGPDLVPYTVDKNALKVGLYTPGMHLPVLPVDTLLERQPDYVFILAWNFKQEIMRQQAKYRERGGRFIVPIPQPEVI